jgi:type II secretory pathway component GspD/PulD (secretin)
MTNRLLLLLLLSLLSPPLLAGYPLEIIELKGRTPEEMIPIIKPLVEPDGSVAGMQNQLIIRTSPENMREINKLLQRLDHPPRQLMIYIRQGIAVNRGGSGVSADVNAMVGKDAKVVVGKPGADEGVRVRVRSTRTKSHLDATQHIRAVEGRPAFIATGKSVPIQERTTTVYGDVVQHQDTTRFRDVTTGFYVTPQLIGDQVALRISPHMERAGRVQGTYDVQYAYTSIRGRLGEWIDIGGTNRGSYRDRDGILRSATTSGHEDRSIQLLVEELH